MREIKFQAWDLDAQQMYNWESIKQLFHEHLDHPRVKVRQYTGLKDRQDREIYEGDVVKGIRDSHWHGGYDIVLGKVEFDEETCSFRVDGGGLLYRIEEIEVIGDVYRNPELLEAKK
ncbi:YopX family protein [Bacillus licheniformis]|uniref:YopX family protein n=1 Tax=Bacillus licheniformis TaxID=1402 RepID=UPI0022804AC9|nr:YopX family protein [Bacillus licheniformis]MCY7740837.1 YopX family protein [Bacillus licheniformis]